MLSVLGGLVVVAVLVWVVGRLLPKDVEATLAQADAAARPVLVQANGDDTGDDASDADKADLPRAEKLYREAIPLIKDPAAKADAYYKLAQVQWAYRTRDEYAAQRNQKVGEARASILASVTGAPDQIPPRKFYTDMLLEIGDLRQFIREANDLLKLDPNDHELRFRMISVRAAQVATKDEATLIREIIQQYQELIDKTRKPEHFIALAGFLSRMERYGDPGEVLLRGIEHSEKSGLLSVMYGGYLLQKGKPTREAEAAAWEAEVATWFDKAKADAGDDVNVWEALANYYFGMGKQDDALQATARIKAADVTSPRAYLIEGRIYSSRRQPDEAIATYRAGLEAMRTAAGRARDARERQSVLYHRLGEALLERALFDTARSLTADERTAILTEAQDCLEHVVAVAGADSYETYSLQGRMALAKNNVPDAVRNLRAAYEKPRGVELNTVLLLYDAYKLNGTPGPGEEILRRILEINPGNPQVNLLMARHCLDFNKDPLRAEGHLRIVLASNADNPEALRIQREINILKGGIPDGIDVASMPVLMMRVQQMIAQGQGAEAVIMIEQLYQQDENNLAVFELLCNLYLQSNQVDKAKTLIATLKAKDSTDEKLRSQLDMTMELLSETDPAKRFELMLKRIEMQTQDPVAMNLGKARLSAQLGRKEDCTKFLELAETANPQNVQVITAQFEFALGTSDFERAQVYADKAAQANIDRCDGLKFQAVLLRAQNKVDESLAVMEQVLEKLPDDKDIRAMAGELYLSQGNRDKAREHYQHLANSDRANFPGNYAMAKLTEDDPAQRAAHREYVRRCLLVRPDHPDVRNWRLNLVELDGRPDLALAAREQLFQQDPSDLRNIVSLARLHEMGGRGEAAVRMYQELLKRSPNPLGAAEAYCQYLLRTNQVADVYRVLEDVMKLDKIDRVAGFMMRGRMLANINADHARSAFQQAIAAAANTQDARPLLAMGQFLGWRGAQAGMVDPRVAMELNTEALGFYEQWFDATPGAAGSDEEYQLLALRVKVGQTDQAEARLMQILRSDGDNMKAQFALADLYRVQKDEARTLEVLDSVVNLNPSLIQPLMVRAAYHESMGNLPQAQSDIEQARKSEQGKDNMAVSQSLAAVLLKQRKFSQAVTLLTEMVNKDQTYQPASDLLLSAYLMQKDWNNVSSQLTFARRRPTLARDVGRQIELLTIEAQMYRETNKMRESLETMDKALALAKDDPRMLARWSAAHVEAKEYDKVLQKVRGYSGATYQPLRLYEAIALLGKNNVPAANTMLTEMVKNARGELLIILDSAGRYYKPSDGLAMAREWVAMRDEPMTNLFLGDMFLANKDVAAAEGAYRKGVSQAKSAGEKLQLHSRLGQMLYREYLADREANRDLLDRTIEAWQAVLEIDPNNFGAMNNLAYIFTDDLDDPVRALPYAEQAATRDPSPDVLDTLGWTKAKLAAAEGDRDKRSQDLAAAARILRDAYELEKQLNIVHSVTVSYHLGWTYEQLGDMDTARACYDNANATLNDDEKNPLYASVKDALNRVKK